MTETKEVLTSRSLSIEVETWKTIRMFILKIQSEKTQSDILAEMLKRFTNKEIKIEKDYKIGERKVTKVTMNSKNWELYNKLIKGSRAMIINSLLKIWVEENS